MDCERLRPAIFLDRDGTINREVNHLSSPEELELLPGVKEALLRLEAHFPLVVVTNQAAIARGKLSKPTLEVIHERLVDLLDPVGLTGIYFCPHHPTAGEEPYRRVCPCRKPAPGMLLQASSDLAVDLERSVIIGDKLSDLEAGRSVGCRTILVLTGYGLEESSKLVANPWRPDFVADDLGAAADWIIKEML